MSILPKHSKECATCKRRYPLTCGIAACLQCKLPLQRVEQAPTVTEDEWNDLSYVYGRTIPRALSQEERDLMDAQWEVLEDEAERRAPWFTLADLIGEGFVRGSVRPS